jgi:hypothetical protein
MEKIMNKTMETIVTWEKKHTISDLSTDAFDKALIFYT